MNPCKGNCPAPGVCEACDQRLYESLLADDSFMAGYYEWERVNYIYPKLREAQHAKERPSMTNRSRTAKIAAVLEHHDMELLMSVADSEPLKTTPRQGRSVKKLLYLGLIQGENPYSLTKRGEAYVTEEITYYQQRGLTNPWNPK